MNGASIQVTVIDDHPVFRIGMTALLNSLPGIVVVGQADSAAAARALFDAEHATDVVLLDLDLGDGSGIDVAPGSPGSSPRLQDPRRDDARG